MFRDTPLIMKLFALITCVSALLSANLTAQTDWKMERERDGIRIYTKQEVNSKYHSFKGIVLVAASVEDVTKVLKDADNYTRWYGFTNTSQLLEQTENEQFNYVETKFPWPFKNRDMVYKMTIDTSKDEMIFHLTGLPDYMPERKGIVRMRKAEGYILLEPEGENTRVTYVFHSDPGKSIPSRLANSSIGELPYSTLSGLRNIFTPEK